MNEQERKVALAVSKSMRTRAAMVARDEGVIPCDWLAKKIAKKIEELSLLDEDYLQYIDPNSTNQDSID